MYQTHFTSPSPTVHTHHTTLNSLWCANSIINLIAGGLLAPTRCVSINYWLSSGDIRESEQY